MKRIGIAAVFFFGLFSALARFGKEKNGGNKETSPHLLEKRIWRIG